jgi:hypothetical protein
MLQQTISPLEKTRKIILAIGTAPAFIVGSLMIIVVGLGLEGGLFFVIQGIFIVGLTYFSVLGPKNVRLTIIGTAGNILIGATSICLATSNLVRGWWPLLLMPFAVCLLAGFTSLFVWWAKK